MTNEDLRIKNYRFSKNTLLYKLLLRYLKNVKYNINKLELKDNIYYAHFSNERKVENIISRRYNIIPLIVNKNKTISYNSPIVFIDNLISSITNKNMFKPNKETIDFMKIFYQFIGFDNIIKILHIALSKCKDYDIQFLIKHYENYYGVKLNKYTFFDKLVERIQNDIKKGKYPTLIFKNQDKKLTEEYSEEFISIMSVAKTFHILLNNYICENFFEYVPLDKIEEYKCEKKRQEEEIRNQWDFNF